MGNYHPEKDVIRVLTGISGQKKADVEKKIIDYILNASDVAEQERRILSVAVPIAREFVSPLTRILTGSLSRKLQASSLGRDTFRRMKQRGDQVRKVGSALIQSIGAALFETQQYDILLRLQRHRTSSIGASYNFAPDDIFPKLEAGGLSSEDIRNEAKMWVALDFFRCAGVNVDRAKALGLFLLRKIAQFLRESAAKVATMSSIQDGMSAYAIILGSAMSPPNERAPQRLWLIRLLHHLDDDTTACDIWRSVLNLLTWTPQGAPVLKADFDLNAEDLRDHVQHLFQHFFQPLGEGRRVDFPLVLASTETVLLDRWLETREQRDRQVREAGQRVLTWFAEQQENLAPKLAEMRRQILEQHAADYRPNGADHFLIKLAPLNNAGIHSVAFYAEGHQFPDAELRISVEVETPGLVLYPARLKDLWLEVDHPGFLENLTHPDTDTLRRLLEFVIVSIIHGITVTGKRFKPAARANAESSLQGRRPHVIRGHKHRLPDGHTMSVDAIAYVEERGIKVPEGYTWIPQHWWGKNQRAYDYPTDPWAIYTEDDLHEDGGDG